jgi:hypothetical protein
MQLAECSLSPAPPVVEDVTLLGIARLMVRYAEYLQSPKYGTQQGYWEDQTTICEQHYG